MLDTLSPVARRALAVLLAGLVMSMLFVWIVEPIAMLISRQRMELAHNHQRNARLIAARDWPTSDAPRQRNASILMPSGRRQAALLQRNMLQNIARSNQLALEMREIVLTDEGQARIYASDIVMRGPHDAILAAFAAIEQARPMMRVRALRIEISPNVDGELSASARIVAIGAQR